MSSELRKRVTVVTSGHLATCPRMLKAARSLAEAGYRVRVVSTRFVPWADEADEEIARGSAAPWDDWTRVPLGFTDRAVHRTAERLCRGLPRTALGGLPEGLAAHAYSPFFRPLRSAVADDPGDLIYAGTAGALAAAAAAARRTGTPYALDLEDFHPAEQDPSPQAERSHALVDGLLRRCLPGAAFLTAASGPIAEAYGEGFGLRPVVVHNTFPLPSTPAEPPEAASEDADHPLRLYWFSQTMGPGRGLEEAVEAVGLGGFPAELHLRGRTDAAYLRSLEARAADRAPRLRLVHHEPAHPDRMVELCRPYDVGLALEQGHVLNRALCLSNKPLTYILAGLAVAFTDTPGQRPLAESLGEGGFLYRFGDTERLAAGLRRWARDGAALARARRASWEAARRRWHWEHPAERGTVLKAVEKALEASRSADGR